MYKAKGSSHIRKYKCLEALMGEFSRLPSIAQVETESLVPEMCTDVGQVVP